MNKKILAIALTIMITAVIGAVLVIQGVESATGTRTDPLTKYRFRVEIDGIVAAGFKEVEGLNVTVEVIEYRDGNEISLAPRLIPGLAHYGPLVLRYGITSSSELWDWMEKILDGYDDRRSMSVIIQDREGHDVVRYNLSEAWPSGFKVDKLDSLGSSIAIEELVIQYERLDRIGAEG